MLTVLSGRQPFRRSALRRCACIRDRLCHHSLGRTFGILRRKDWPLTLGQAYRRGRLVEKRCLVGPCQQAHDSRRKYFHLFVHPLRICSIS
jgi:hypothetical protein